MADIYLKFTEEVKGEAKESNHTDWIQVESLSMGVSMSVSSAKGNAGGATAGGCNHQDLTMSKMVDLASPLLMQHCSSGKHFDKAQIELFRSDGSDKKVKYLEITLTEVLISSYQSSVSTGSGDAGMDSFSLNYGTIVENYTLQKRKDGSGGGNTSGSWNLIEDKIKV